jgi:hypothetical protein
MRLMPVKCAYCGCHIAWTDDELNSEPSETVELFCEECMVGVDKENSFWSQKELVDQGEQ